MNMLLVRQDQQLLKKVLVPPESMALGDCYPHMEGHEAVPLAPMSMLLIEQGQHPLNKGPIPQETRTLGKRYPHMWGQPTVLSKLPLGFGNTGMFLKDMLRRGIQLNKFHIHPHEMSKMPNVGVAHTFPETP